jgi:biotin-dependent enzyme
MKMQNEIQATKKGKVTKIAVKEASARSTLSTPPASATHPKQNAQPKPGVPQSKRLYCPLAFKIWSAK